MKINISIEARMTSTRLPGKSLILINDKPALEIMVDRIKKTQLVDNIIVATTINEEDDTIVLWCKNNHIDYFRGSENNVYDRIIQTHREFSTDIVVELSADCVLLGADLINEGIKLYLDNNYDYISLVDPTGLGLQVYSLKVLESVSHGRNLEYLDKEHVTPYLYTSGKYKILKKIMYEDLGCPEICLALDTIEDWEVLDNICKNFNNFTFTFKEIVEFMQNNPEKVNANKFIQRKGLS